MEKDKGLIVSIGSGENKKTISSSTPAIKIEGKTLLGSSSGVDLVFVIDTTGSMSNKIEGLLATCERFVDEFAKLDLNHRIAIIAFGDLRVPRDRIEKTEFTSEVDITRKSLRNIPRYGGGGNQGESSLEALEKAIGMPYRTDAVKVIVLITDEPAHQENIRANDMINRLSEGEFLVFVVSPPLKYFKEMAVKNAGKWYKVAANTDFTEILNMFESIAEKVSCIVSDVYTLGDGSVSKYLQLKSSNS